MGIGRFVESGFLIGERYRLLERLGHGGMSVVWRADDDVLGRQVAVKVLSARLATDPGTLHQLRAEARAAAGLRHPAVVEVYDYGETTHRGKLLPYVVMELVDGRTMADLLSGDRIPWRLAVLICAQVAAALAAAHARGVVHRDVKPGNVMVTSSGVKLVDFGISAAVGVMDGADGQLLGTPAYLAPERIRGGPVRPATDVYALGLLLYLSLAGRMPWRASTATQMLKAHYYTEPAPMPAVPGLPSEVVRLVSRCLAKKPDERPAAAQVARVLGEIAGLPPAELMRAAAAPTVSIPRSRRLAGRAAAGLARVPGGRRTVVAGSTAGALIVAGLVAWPGNGPRTAPPAAAAAAPQACAVRYEVERPARDGRTPVAVSVRNTGAAAMPAWQLSFALPGRQRLLHGWSASWQQQGETIRAGGGALPAGGSVTAGFETTADPGGVAVPRSFTVNGTVCRSETSTPPPATGAAGAGAAGAGAAGAGAAGAGAAGAGAAGAGAAVRPTAAGAAPAGARAAVVAPKPGKGPAKPRTKVKDKGKAKKGKD
ncbi:serine/threonine-protein kinase [Actinoplanes teichomyceticus]|uniref:non-specific serine/threonine protein kinase n=1 Tax=Actinoplanes teichomyceticus TaxID=1867 RepID=A0A561WBF1_ACTTI|nr:serine/threonine-protein kinase [Actinoplanes teichomyceticus]TWG21194.1 serine/threonine-protein kinase [Actinoplanes teichomyceticus]